MGRSSETGITGALFRLAVERERLLFVIVALVLFATGVLHIRALPQNHDVGWLLYAAGEILNGSEPYVDVVEVNPPLILYFMVAVKAVSLLTGISDFIVFHIVLLALVALSVWLGCSVLRRTIPESHRLVVPSLCLLSIAMLTTWAAYHFGQREHMAITLVLPYLFAAAGRAEGKELPTGIAVVIGVLAGVGVGLKPFFLPVWLGVEVYLAVTRSPSLWRRPEQIALVAVLVAYALSVLVFVPAYFELAALAARPYRSYHSKALSQIVTSAGTLFAMLVLLASSNVPASGPLKRLRGVLTVAMLMFVAGVVLQGKGWGYHWLPVQVLGVLLLGIVGLDGVRRLPGRFGYGLLSRAFVAMIAVMTCGFAVFRYGVVEREWARLAKSPFFLYQMMDVVEAHAPGGTIASLTTQVQVSWPLVNYTGVKWGSRFNSLWLLLGIYEDIKFSPNPFPYGRLEEAGELEKYLIDSVVTDLREYQPDLLVVEIFPPRYEMRGFAYLDFFARDERFREIFTRYEPLELVGPLAVYKRNGAAAVEEGSGE
ncbi:MAG: hypothetical protein JSV86_02060 [Gemmatimonadota bacterium]|nr:MAG: hypothetical protein JSV86_02060 [Gemmatimonadota bacterium]